MTKTSVFWIGALMGFSFAVGCGAAVLVIPAARAQSTPRYEYLGIDQGWGGGRWANEAGAEGWHLVGILPVGGTMVFERELP